MRVIFISLIFLFGCSSIKMVSKTGNAPINSESENPIYLLSQFDSIPRKSVLLGSFKMIENKSGRWSSVYDKIKTLALQNKANTIKIDEYHMNGGYGTRGNLGLVLGRLYSQPIETNDQSQTKSDSIFLFVSRYEKDKLLNKAFNIDLYKDEQLVGKLPSRSTYKIPVKLGDHIRLSTQRNQSELLVDIEKPINYYVEVFKQIDHAGIPGQSAMLSFGDAYFLPVDSMLGKLEYENILQLNGKK
jgi:hypothetical protein